MTARQYDDILAVEGFQSLLEADAESVEGDEWIARAAWRRYFRRAWRIFMQGGMWVSWRTHPVPAEPKDSRFIVFIWDMGIGCDSIYPQPTGQYTIFLNGQKALSFCHTPVNRCWSRGEFRFYYEIKRREGQCSFGLGYLLAPARLAKPEASATIRISACDSESRNWFMLCQYGEASLADGVSFNDPNARPAFTDDGIAAVRVGPERLCRNGLNLYWGDLHVHSNMANYIEASPEENYDYGRYVSQLDFMALTDQDHFLSAEQFQKVIAHANTRCVPGEFTTFIAYEWSSRRYGHRNVIFRGDRGVLIQRHDVPNPYDPPYPPENHDSFRQLTEGLRRFGEPCMLIPHHPAMTSMGAVQWSNFDSELEAVVEVYSLWGSSEHKDAPGKSLMNDHRSGSYVQDALARGYCLGFLGSGETGDGRPGNTQWRSSYARKAGFPLNPLGGGLAAVWAQRCTRESIFDAIRARRCYATTNARICLDMRVNERWMGQTIPVKPAQLADGVAVNLDLWVRGTDDIEGIHVFRNGKVTAYGVGYGQEMAFTHCGVLRQQDCLKSGGQRFAYYYVRVRQKNGHLAWSSPVWFWESVDSGGHGT